MLYFRELILNNTNNHKPNVKRNKKEQTQCKMQIKAEANDVQVSWNYILFISSNGHLRLKFLG